MHNDIDQMLSKRAMPQARPHLAEMIIAAANPKVARDQKPAWRDIFSALQDAFVLPHPVLALVFILFIGVSFGLATDTAEAAQEISTTHELSSFMKVKDSFDIGEWL